MPAVKITEDKNQFNNEEAAPSMEKKEDNNKKITRSEFNSKSFNPSFTLLDSVKEEDLSASHKDEVLIIIPKKEKLKEKGSKYIKIG